MGLGGTGPLKSVILKGQGTGGQVEAFNPESPLGKGWKGQQGLRLRPALAFPNQELGPPEEGIIQGAEQGLPYLFSRKCSSGLTSAGPSSRALLLRERRSLGES